MRTPLIVVNWKMNTNLTQAISLVKSMLPGLDKISSVETVICPPFISLNSIKEQLKDTSIKIGAQNMYYKDKGAYTGEISPFMLAGLCDFVIVGHSERRQHFAENDELINNKIKAAFECNIIPILCVGESLGDNEAKRTEEVITRQVENALSDIKPIDKLIIAYEPIWAIGTGRSATGKNANATISLIRSVVNGIWGLNLSQSIRILYGGSVTGTNISEFMVESDIDGGLVGGASLKADDFVDIIAKTSAIITAR